MKSTLMRITFIFLAALFLFMSNPSYSAAEKRVALLIGNSNYDVGRLRNPVTDATDMAAALKKLGFSVILQNDTGHKEMETAIKEFGRQLKKDTVGLFFYAGHGVQIDGRNYLIPLGANIEEEADVKYKAVNINRVFDVMDSAGNKLNIVILDACRDNPYAKSFRTSSRGLAMVGKSPNDTLIAYSTGPGDVASDGSGRNSPYTRALLDNINRPGLSIEQVFKKVRNDLDNTTSGRQKPWYTASLGTDFYFNPGKIKKSDEVKQLTTAEETILSADELENEKRRLEADQRRLEEEKAAFTKQKALEEKKRKIEEESERIAAQREADRQAVLERKQAEADRKKQELEEKRRQIDEEKERLAAEKKAARQAELERKQAKKALAMAPRPDQSTVDSATGIQMIFVKGGCYQMGDTFGDGDKDEKPVHNVCVSNFYIGKYEVTQGQWKKVMGSNPSSFSSCGDSCPVENVSWNDVQEFIGKLNRQSGKNYRLPAEAEWEYAARSGGKSQKYSGGNEVDDVAWYSSNSGSKTHPVGQKQPNSLGIYDMTGNVWEWCNDWYGEKYYGESPRDNPQGPSSGSGRVIRGGSWFDNAAYARASYRIRNNLVYRDYDLGFRLVAPRGQ